MQVILRSFLFFTKNLGLGKENNSGRESIGKHLEDYSKVETETADVENYHAGSNIEEGHVGPPSHMYISPAVTVVVVAAACELWSSDRAVEG